MKLRKGETIRQYCKRNDITLTGKLHRLPDEIWSDTRYSVWKDDGEVEISVAEDGGICICGEDWVF